MAKPGPKTKYTTDRIEKILTLLRGGNTRGTSAQASGVDPVTMQRWMNQYAGFADQVKEAESEAEASHVENIVRAAAKGSWQASAWYLERRRYESWGKKDRIELVNNVRQLAKDHNVEEDAAVAQAETILRELRSQARA